MYVQVVLFQCNIIFIIVPITLTRVPRASLWLRSGQSTMAVAACFGGPVLNLLIGTGVPVLVKNAKLGTLPFRLSNGIIILFICSMVRTTHPASVQS